MIKLENVNKYFGNVHVLKDVNLTVGEGEKVFIMGPSGSGKSTAIRCINHLDEPTTGYVSIDGRVVDKSDRTKVVRDNVSMVFGQFNLYPHLTVLENLTLAPMRLRGYSKWDADELARVTLGRVGLTGKEQAFPEELSIGQQQRVAIARALCAKSRVILLDEPTGAMDREMAQEVLDVMVDLSKENVTMICVTCEIDFAKEMADRVVFMDEGMIVEEGSPSDFFDNPKTDRAKDFLGKWIRH